MQVQVPSACGASDVHASCIPGVDRFHQVRNSPSRESGRTCGSSTKLNADLHAMCMGVFRRPHRIAARMKTYGNSCDAAESRYQSPASFATLTDLLALTSEQESNALKDPLSPIFHLCRKRKTTYSSTTRRDAPSHTLSWSHCDRHRRQRLQAFSKQVDRSSPQRHHLQQSPDKREVASVRTAASQNSKIALVRSPIACQQSPGPTRQAPDTAEAPHTAPPHPHRKAFQLLLRVTCSNSGLVPEALRKRPVAALAQFSLLVSLARDAARAGWSRGRRRIWPEGGASPCLADMCAELCHRVVIAETFPVLKWATTTFLDCLL
jgi:hypothetical protein